MKEFMFYIKNDKDPINSLTGEDHLEFVKKCEDYIGLLKSQSKLIAAQPLVREGKIIRKTFGRWNETELTGSSEIQVGYYHILANDIEEAIKIAKANPEFEYVPSASIEVRQIKTRESETGFLYLSNNQI